MRFTSTAAVSTWRQWRLNSVASSEVPAGTEIQLESLTEIEGREWVQAHLSNGDKGFFRAASIRSQPLHLLDTDST